jgi:FtsP/CotA-like multicopper oxidase with cupredoxin domain
MKRRNFIALGALAVTATSLYSMMRNKMNKGFGMTTSSNLANHLKPIKKLLPIPPLMEGVLKNSTKNYDLTIQNSKHSFFQGVDTDTFGINGSFLGPTLKLVNKEKISVNFTNKLDEPTTMHSHGMHLPAVMDGGPHQVIEPKQTWSSKYKVNQKACTNWYHPHYMGKTAEHVYKGLAGLMIVEDKEIKLLNLPAKYGIDDIPLVLQDRVFDSFGQIDYSPNMRQIMMGYNGNTYLTNGAIEPFVDVENTNIRFRILNGSNSSVYYLKLDDNRSFMQIATDNSLLEYPVKLNILRLSPGERAEIVVDFANDINKKIKLIDANRDKIFLDININKKSNTKTTIPNKLAKLEFLQPSKNTKQRDFIYSGMMARLMLNGKKMNKNRIDEVVHVNQTEIWYIQNNMMMQHNFHMHATHFTVLARNGKREKVLENEKGYKDVVHIPRNESVHLMVKHTDYTDDKYPYMYHCHFLEHEDAGMMGQFTVV